MFLRWFCFVSGLWDYDLSFVGFDADVAFGFAVKLVVLWIVGLVGLMLWWSFLWVGILRIWILVYWFVFVFCGVLFCGFVEFW